MDLAIRLAGYCAVVSVGCGSGAGDAGAQTANVVGWGEHASGKVNAPVNLTDAVAVAAADRHSMALRADGTVVAWGGNGDGQATVPFGLHNVVEVTALGFASEALRADGTIAAWGWPNVVPPGLNNVIELASAGPHGLALRTDGSVVEWWSDTNYVDHDTPPSGLTNVVAVAAGSDHSLALRGDGTVVAWGMNDFGQCQVPSGLSDVVAIAAGAWHSLALRADGTVLAWGAGQTNSGSYPDYGQSLVPDGLRDVIAVAAGSAHSLALRADGTVVAWGAGVSNAGWGLHFGQSIVPAGLTNVVALAGGHVHSLAVIGRGAPVLTTRLNDRRIFAGATAYLRATASGQLPLSYQWQFNGTNLPGATNALLALENVQPTQAGDYSVVVTNALGSTTSSAGRLDVVPILINTQPQSQVGLQGQTVCFSVEARGAALTYQWRFNGKDLPGATNSTLTLADVRLEQTGVYSVVLSNMWGTMVSSEADLQVNNIASWGGGGNTNVPAGLTNLVQVVATGYSSWFSPWYPAFDRSFGLRADGTATFWGDGFLGYPEELAENLSNIVVNLSNVVALAVGPRVFVALRQDGTVLQPKAFQGDSDSVPVAPPDGLNDVVAVSAGGGHVLALRADGSVVAWGEDSSGQTNVPSGLTNTVAIAAGFYHSLALRADGTVVAWGAGQTNSDSWPDYGQSRVPDNLTDVVAIAAGAYNSLALKTDGTVVAWGAGQTNSDSWPDSGQSTVPDDLSNVVAIAAGEANSLALRADGTTVAWGGNSPGQVDFASGLTNVQAISMGEFNMLALLGNGPPVRSASLSHPSWADNRFSVSLPTQSGRVYALEYKDALTDARWTALPLVAGTGGDRTLVDPNPNGLQRFYRVRRW